MAVTQIVGPRIAPYWADPVEWTSTRAYEPFTFVTYQGDSYCSRQDTPIVIDITNDDYWVKVSDYNAQAVALQREMTNTIEAAESSMTNTIQAAENTMTSTINEAKEDFNESINVFNQYLPFDIEPKDGSSKGVTSDGINDAIGTVDSKIDSVNNKVDTIYPLDTIPTDGSIKGITSGGVYSSLYNCEKIYSTVEELKKATTYAGEIVATMSYYANDNGGAIYNISDTQNGLLNITSIKLDNGLFANMHVSPYMHAESIGCKSNDTTFDNSTILNEFWQQYKNHGLIFDSGDYYFANTLSTNGPMYFNVNTYLHLNSENIIDVAVKINPDLTLGDLATPTSSLYDESMCKIKCDRKANTGIEVYTGNSNTFTLVVYNAIKIGVHTRPTKVASKFDVGCYYNVAVIADKSAATEIGILCNSSDCNFIQATAVNAMLGLDITGSDNIFQQYHPWISTSAFWTGSVCVKQEAGTNIFNNFINDTMETTLLLSDTVACTMQIDNLNIVMNTSIVSDTSSYKLTDFENANDTVLASSVLSIANYLDIAGVVTPLSIGTTGKLPFRTEINCLNAASKIWDYDLNYAPQGSFLINYSHDIPHKPTNYTSGIGILTCFKSGYASTQILSRGPNDYIGENHLDYPTNDKWTTAPKTLCVRFYQHKTIASTWFYLAAYGQSALSNS